MTYAGSTGIFPRPPVPSTTKVGTAGPLIQPRSPRAISVISASGTVNCQFPWALSLE
jgi:hypothetical protein